MKIQTSLESGKGFERPQIPEGLYKAKLKEVKEISDGQYGHRVAFIYSVVVNNKEVELSHITYVPEIANPDNKFGRVLIAHGVQLGGEIDITPLFGTEARVLIEDYEYTEDNKKLKASSISKVKPLVEEELN